MKPPEDPADHAEEFAHQHERELDQFCAVRMEELGIPDHLLGATDFQGGGAWRAFIPQEREGGNITDGISVNSGVFNPHLLKNNPVWAKARLRDRIDAVITHEYEEDRTGSQAGSLQAGPNTLLPIRDGARIILQAMKPPE